MQARGSDQGFPSRAARCEVPTCDMRPTRRLSAAVAAAGWALVPCAVAATVALDHQLAGVGRADLSALHADNVGVVAGMVSAATVGLALGVRKPAHPVGWLFLGLADLLALDGLATGYAAYGAVARPGSLRSTTARSWPGWPCWPWSCT